MTYNPSHPDEIRRAADILLANDLAIYPVGGDKKPIGQWTRGARNYVLEPATRDIVDQWCTHGRNGKPVLGWAVLSSTVTRQVTLDVETPGMDYPQITRVFDVLPDTCQQTSRRGGRHAYLRIDGDMPTDTALARVDLGQVDANGKPILTLLAEVRRHRNYAVIHGPGRPQLPDNWRVHTITRDDYETLLQPIRDLNQAPERKTTIRTGGDTAKNLDQLHPIARAIATGALSPLAVLPDGWEIVGTRPDGAVEFLRDGATSDTTGNVKNGVFVIHSTSVEWAEYTSDDTGQDIRPKGLPGNVVLAKARYDGDYAKAMQAVEQAAADAAGVGLDNSSPFATWPLDVLADIHHHRQQQHQEWLRAQEQALTEWIIPPTAQDDQDDNEDQDTGGNDDASGDQSSWQPVDLGPILDGEWTPEHPDLMPRNDGQGLLYRGRVHSLHGESESAKSLIAQAESARVLTAGGTVAYLDFESDAASVTNRLLGLGAPPQAIRDRFTYIHPDESVSASQAATEGWRDLLASTVDLVIIDGVTDAMSVLGFNGGDPNADATGFIRRFCKRLADRTGAAVVIIDHVTKNSEGRGRFAIGGQAKMAGLTGAAYIVEPGPTPPMPGRVGSVVLRIAKDRPGGIRPHCSVRHRASDRTQEAATITFDSTGAATIVTVTAPTDTSASDSGNPATPFQPTYLMEKVSRVLEPLTDPISVNAITQAVTGRRENIVRALDCLVTGGYVTRENGPRSTLLHRSTRPYREADWFREPVEETTTSPHPAGATASGSRLRDGNREPVATPTADRFPEPVGNQSGTSQNPPPNGHDHYLASALVTCDTCGMNALTTPCSTCRRSHRTTTRQEATA